MRTLSLTVLTGLALAGCAQQPAADRATTASGLVPQAQRHTDRRIEADRQAIAATQARLQKLNQAGVPQNHYTLAKAQCWLDTAYTQYEENDRTGYVAEALSEAQRLALALEADRNSRAGYETPLLNTSTRFREDLWSRLGAFKSNAATSVCTARTVACAEVRLVRAGHAEQQTGWRAATPHIHMVEDALRRAAGEAAACPLPAPRVVPAPVPAPVVVAPPPPPPPAPPAPAPVVITRENFVLLSDSLFRFGRSGSADLLPGGQAKLDVLAQRLQGYRSIQALTITGHADRIGTATKNDQLALARAQTVLAYVVSKGVKAAQVQANGRGATEPATGNTCSAKMPRTALIECLQPDRRVSIEVTGQAR